MFVGYSGGMDSTVLLHLLWRWREQSRLASASAAAAPPPIIKAIHVNHQLQPQADDWQQHCEQICEQWGIPLIVEQVVVDGRQSSPEQAAREARYQAFRHYVGRDAVLMLAHHRDDQVETLLQRLARGSGPLGLGAMQADSRSVGMRILRPLLEQDRDTLMRYAEAQKLRWVDDPSNLSDQFERNYIRRQVLPSWRKLKPNLNRTIARSARLSREASGLLDQLAALDLGQPRADGGLSTCRLNGLDRPRQKNLVRYWLHTLGARAPSATVLGRVLDELIPAAADGNPKVVWGQICIRRFRQVLYLTPSDLDGGQLFAPTPVENLDALQGITSALGYLQVLPTAARLPVEAETSFSRRRLQQGELRLQLRSGGERIKPHGQATKPLKHWFQALAVPPWLRMHWPILYCDAEIAGLPGLLVCDGFEPDSEQDRVAIHWHWRIPLPGATGWVE